MTMITLPERKEYRAALKQLSDLREMVDKAISQGTTLPSNVALAMEKMTGTAEIHGQFRAIDDFYSRLDKQYDEALRTAAQFKLSPFCEYMFRNEPPAMHHEFLIDHMEAVHNKEIMRLAVSMPPGSAKALTLDTPIPTPDGWTTMGELSVGDSVFDESGQPCQVTWVSPIWKNRPIYDVVTDCGDVIQADHDHEWRVRMCGKRDVFKIKETHEIAAPRSKRVMIERAKALELPEADLPIDPYLLGFWLGDGHSSGVRITCSEEDQGFVRAEFESVGYTTTDHSVPTNFGVLGIRHLFVEMGLINDPAHNIYGHKHIPSRYMRASVEQRLRLLQGLIDSDGTVCKQRGCSTFTNTDKDLAFQVQELVRSLGVKAGWSESPAVFNGKACGTCYRVSFYLKDSALLPRKARHTRNQDRTPNTYVSATRAGVADTVCIEVNSPSHLFLAGKSMTPTHNSTYSSIRFAAWHLGRRVNDRWLQGAHTQTFAKDRLGKPVRNLIASARYRDVFPERVLSASSSAADYFEFANSPVAYYKAIGVGQGISGFRADIGAIDDPIASREDAESPTIRRKLHEWFEDDFGTRPMPGSPIFVVACVAGDAPVSMADGSWKRMDEVEVGDQVLSWGDSGVTSETVTRTIPQGTDRIFEIKAGTHTVRANARHPILVCTPAGNVWKRVEELSPNDLLVAGASTTEPSFDMDPDEAWVLGFMKGDGWVTVNKKKNYDKFRNKYYATQSYVTCIADCPKYPERVSRVLKFFEDKYGAKFKLTEFGYYRSEKATLGRDMLRWGMDKKASGKRVEPEFFQMPQSSRMAFLDGYAAADGYYMEVGNYRVQSVTTCNYQLAQDMRHLARMSGRRVTSIYSRNGVNQPPNSPTPVNWERHDFRFHEDPTLEPVWTVPVKDIIDTGEYEEVYDLTVTGAETFFVDGIVTHNTRWHEDDLIGHELEKMKAGNAAYDWEVINIPALAEDDDPLGRAPGEGLWPEVFGTEWYTLKKIDSTARSWNSLYQGKPSDEEGGVLKRSEISRWKAPPRDLKRKDGSLYKKIIKRKTLSVDCAEKATQRSDWTAATVWYETFDGKHYLVHAARCRKEFTDMSKWIDELARGFNVDQILVEDKGAGTQYIQVDKERSNGPAPVIAISTNNNSKQFRFDGVTPMFTSGRALFPEKGTDWIADLEDELLKFPNAKNDDYVDSVSQYLSYSRKSGVKRGTRKAKSGMHGV